MTTTTKSDLIAKKIHKLNIKNVLIAATNYTEKAGFIVKLEIKRFRERMRAKQPPVNYDLNELFNCLSPEL